MLTKQTPGDHYVEIFYFVKLVLNLEFIRKRWHSFDRGGVQK